MDCHFLLQGIFPTQGSSPGLPHCRQTLYRLNHQGSPRGKELDLITSYQVEVSPAFPLSLCCHLVGRFSWIFRGGVGIKVPQCLLHWLRGQLLLGLYGHGLLLQGQVLTPLDLFWHFLNKENRKFFFLSFFFNLHGGDWNSASLCGACGLSSAMLGSDEKPLVPYLALLDTVSARICVGSDILITTWCPWKSGQL